MFPPQRQEVLPQHSINALVVLTKGTDHPLPIDDVPQHNGRRHRVEVAGPVALLLKTAIADFAKPVEEHRPGMRIEHLDLVQPGMHTATQFHTLQSVQDFHSAQINGV